MKKFLLFLFIGNLSLATVSAQSMMTIRDVYDFNVGDEFQTTTNSGVPNANRYKILTKRFSLTNDAVFYTQSYNNYSAYPDYSTTPPHLVYTFTVGTQAIYYANLDTLINAQYKGLPNDSCNSSKDSLYTVQSCSTAVQEYEHKTCTACCFEGKYYDDVYGKGLGLVSHHYTYAAYSIDTRTYLFYYKKDSVGCGTPDNTLAAINKYELAQQNINLYPNPAKDVLNVEFEMPNEKAELKLFDVNGKLVLTQTINGKAIIDASNFNAGVYSLSIINNEGIVNKKLIIVK